jgi:hypothetical protein
VDFSDATLVEHAREIHKELDVLLHAVDHGLRNIIRVANVRLFKDGEFYPGMRPSEVKGALGRRRA